MYETEKNYKKYARKMKTLLNNLFKTINIIKFSTFQGFFLLFY